MSRYLEKYETYVGTGHICRGQFMNDKANGFHVIWRGCGIGGHLKTKEEARLLIYQQAKLETIKKLQEVEAQKQALEHTLDLLGEEVWDLGQFRVELDKEDK